MKKDPTAFRERFKAWKDGKDPYRYLYDNQSGSWNRITDDENADAFANFVATPNGSRPTFSMYENTLNPTLPVSKNESVVPDNTLWTRQRVEKANNTRTWRSDVADVMHSIGEGAMLASTFAAPEVEPLVNPAYQAIKGIVTNAARSNASKILANPRNFLFVIPEVPLYEIQNIPGYLLKTLMRGNPLEKLLSGFGTVNVNNIKAAALKASDVEKEVINKVLSSEQFAGQKAVDYNDFRKAVLDELIGSYNRVPLTKWLNYGLDRLGLREREVPEGKTMSEMIDQYKDDPLFKERWEPRKGPDGRTYYIDKVENTVFDDYTVVSWIQKNLAPETTRLNTFTFESPRIPYGNTKHYEGNPIGHSRTYTTSDEPDVLHVMESQSDWGQYKFFELIPRRLTEELEYTHMSNALERLLRKVPQLFKEEYSKLRYDVLTYKGDIPDDVYNNYSEEFKNFVEELLNPYAPYPTENAVLRWNRIYNYNNNSLFKYLHDNYLQRQLQENLRYAAENGLTKMRYPTSETAAKIEGYSKKSYADADPNLKAEHKEKIKKLFDEASKYGDPYELYRLGHPSALAWNAENERWQKYLNSVVKYDYSPEHQTILKKYADFPKLYKKLYKDADVRIITDSKGNTWYEVDVPKDYLNLEWKYNFGKDLFRRTILRPKLKF